METKLTKEETERKKELGFRIGLIESIHIDKSNLQHIAKTENISGTLLNEINRILKAQKTETESFYLPQIEERNKIIDECEKFFSEIRELPIQGSSSILAVRVVAKQILQSIQSLKQKDANLAIPKE